MESSGNESFDHNFAKIIEVFTELGYPQKLIEQWTLPQRDARTIANIIKEHQPHNILEVGTFVGLTTLLMALISPRETHIHTIDPNFPLLIEMDAMRSRMYESNTDIKTQELALQAADLLGVKNKITFHAGGFSTDNSFSSYNTSPSRRIKITGPDVCKSYGPFDFIFIDGLHYEEDVFSDVNLASKYLSPHGFIALHDVLGPWGSNVRRAIYHFLEKNNNYIFSHNKLSNVHDTIGLLRKFDNKPDQIYITGDPEIKNTGLIQEKIFSNLSAILLTMLSPSNIVQIGGDIRFLETMINLGVPGECAYVSLSPEECHSSILIKQLNIQRKNEFERKYDLCLIIEIMDLIPAEFIDNIIQASIDASDTILFASSPPGESGLYQQNNKPISYWMEKYFRKGYIFYDIIRTKMEPINFSDVLIADYKHLSSYLMNTYIVKKIDKSGLESYNKKAVKDIIFEKERRIEDLSMQNIYQKCIYEQNRKKMQEIIDSYNSYISENKILYEEIERINIFNKKVIYNTVKRIKEIIQKRLGLLSS